MNELHSRMLASERTKLRAVQDKLPDAIARQDWATVAGLACAAEAIARRLALTLDQIKRQETNNGHS